MLDLMAPASRRYGIITNLVQGCHGFTALSWAFAWASSKSTLASHVWVPKMLQTLSLNASLVLTLTTLYCLGQQALSR